MCQSGDLAKNKKHGVHSVHRIILTGGGTGGHIFPAIAVAQALKQEADVEKIFYIGGVKNMEKSAAEKENLPFYPISVSGMPRKNYLALVFWAVELLFAVIKSFFYIKKLKPTVVFATGGYVSGAVLIAAKLAGVPFVIHEPDAHPGLVSRVFAKRIMGAKAVSIAFEEAREFLEAKNSESENIILNGNPIRSSFCEVSRIDTFTNVANTVKREALNRLNLDPDKKTLLVMGGSQGAQTINNAMINAVQLFLAKGIQVIHQTGAKNYEEFMNRFKDKHGEITRGYIPKAFFEDMATPLNAADIAVSRSGSLSISELCLCGIPSVLIPFPYAAADHQRFNARAMEKAGASVYLEDSDCTGEKLFEIISKLLADEKTLCGMKSASFLLAKPDAVKNIVKLLLQP